MEEQKNEFRTRKYQVTINNPIEKGFTHEKIKEIIDSGQAVIYYCMADEIGEEGTHHTHVFINFVNTMRFSTLKAMFPPAHFEFANGTARENRDYVFKEGKWAKDKKAETQVEGTQEEYGECPFERQGQRNDLTDLYDYINSGMSDYEILAINQNYMLQIEKIQKVRRVLLSEKYKHTFRELEVIYMYGETGSGKTRSIMEKYGYANIYRVTDYDHPFDAYQMQDVILFDEFRGQLRLYDMLNYLDGYPLELPCRYENKVACFTRVYLVSNIPLEDQYHKAKVENRETYDAFMRRINLVIEKNKDKEEQYTMWNGEVPPKD